MNPAVADFAGALEAFDSVERATCLEE